MKRHRSGVRHKERRFIRHPSRMPINFELQADLPRQANYLRNVSEGGLCFDSSVALELNVAIRVIIPLLGQQYEAEGAVVWCEPSPDGFAIGVRFFSAQDRFCVRMVEQLCYIEDYRLQVEREEGRTLSSEQAADEWIARFADQFPGLH